MKIVKFEKKGNGNYQVYLDNGDKKLINEDVILKYKLLYKKEIEDGELLNILKDNYNYDAYNKCVKYISVRVRSIHEIREYLKRMSVSDNKIDEIVDRLIKNRLLDDNEFTRAFVSDKIKFSTMGPYKIVQELKKQDIDDEIIWKYINDIDDNVLNEKINKQINKIIKSNRKNINVRNKVYNNLINLGYSGEMILDNLNKYNL